MEQLAARIAPAGVTYTWKGGNTGDPSKWEEPANWTASDRTTNTYPTRATDVAVLDGTGTATCTLTSAEDISQLQITGTVGLTLSANLTLENGGSMSASLATIDNSAAVVWTIKNGTFDWTDGTINTAAADTLGTVVIGGGPSTTNPVLQFHTTGTSSHGFGDNITVKSGGILILGNSDLVTLYKKPTITNNGLIDITSGTPGPIGAAGTTNALLVNPGDPVVDIINNNLIQKDTSAGSYIIQDPIKGSGAFAQLIILSGTLHVTGTDPQLQFWSVIDTGALSSVQVKVGTTLQVDSGLFLQQGSFVTIGQGTATIQGNVQLGDPGNNSPDFSVGSRRDVVPNAASVTVTGNFDWEGGNVDVLLNLSQTPQYGTLTVQGPNGMTIATKGTTLSLVFGGAGTLPVQIVAMQTSIANGIRNAPAAAVTPGYGQPTIPANGTNKYVLTEIMPPALAAHAPAAAPGPPAAPLVFNLLAEGWEEDAAAIMAALTAPAPSRTKSAGGDGLD